MREIKTLDDLKEGILSKLPEAHLLNYTVGGVTPYKIGISKACRGDRYITCWCNYGRLI